MKNCFKSISMLVKKFPSYLIEEILSIIFSVLSSIIPIYIMSDVITMYQNNDEFKSIIIYIVIRFAILSVIGIFLFLLDLYKMNIQRLFIAKTAEEFYNKLSVIDYDFHESPTFLNDYTRALEEGVENIYNVANNSFQVIKVLCQSISIFTILATLNLYTILIASGIGLLYLLICIRLGYINKKRRKEERPHQRYSWYSNRAFTVKDGMADIKTSDIDKILIENNEQNLQKVVKIIDKYAPKQTIWAFISELLLAIIYPVTVAIIAYTTTDISSKLADFAALTVAASSLSMLITRLAGVIGEVESTLPDTKVPFDLLKMQGKIEGVVKKPFTKDFEKLELENVTFSYIGNKNQLEDISISISKGEHVAIVGSNGAGKTTLVKLLLRLYDPNNGSIKINGQNYTEFTVDDIRKKVGAVFQNIETYAVSIAENILLRKPATKEDYDLIDEALKFSGLYDYVYSLKDGINTEISREFHNDGAIFSGGQNQRLAIARGYAQNYQLFILDEPSSALDPIAEAQVYKNMLELGKDKTLVFISHRLTTTVNADKIFLFDNGKIIESGTHEELMKQKGLYHKMFVSQSSKYIGEDYE